jgi:hypothetical protein
MITGDRARKLASRACSRDPWTCQPPGRARAPVVRPPGRARAPRCAPPFFAIRALVIAHPRWYHTLSDVTRRALFGLACAMPQSEAFAPDSTRVLLESAT